MQIRLTLHVPRRRPRPVELVVRWRRPETVATLREALADHLGEPVEALVVDGHALPDDHPVGVPPLLDGASAAVAGPEVARGRGAGPAGPGTVLEVVSVGGPDAGRALPLTPPGVVVGRSPAAGLRLDDPSLSRSHCRLDVGPDGVRVVDLGSTNGVEVDGARVAGAALVDTTSRMVIGATALRLLRTGPPGAPVRHPGDGTVVVSPAPAASAAPPVTELVAPRAPEPPTRARVPWVAALAPVPVVAVLAVFLGPQVLAFAVLGPVVLLATGLGDRWGSGRRHRRAVAEHADALAEHEAHVEAALAAELRWRHLRHPDPHEVGSRATRRGSGLWSGGERTVRLGLGDVAASCRVVDDRGVTAPRLVRGAPVVVDLAEAGGLGLVGPESGTRRLLAALVGQLVVRNPPSRLVVDVVGGGAEWTWLDLLPHRSTSEDDERVVLVVPDVEAPGVTARVAAVHAAGGVVLAAATVTARLPEACGAHVELVGGGRIRLSGNGADDTAVADGVGPAWADRLARALAPLREQGTSDADLPRELGLADVLGDAALTVDGVGRRWAAAERPTAVVGATATGAFRLDLATDGPHVLVGGTTGSGKSEFLRTLVTGLALDSPPEDLTLLLVDFKGGAAFGPCARLPHVVGLVTDLDDYLVRRVLTSLEAELRRREEMLAAHGCADLDDHRRSADSGDRIPRLVVVVDELRALVDGHPEVAGALARLAAQGRSLGMHLVLATQRPAGTVTAEVQANVNLRLAFRVRDRADSHHIVEDDSAALLPVDRPGRGVSRGGDGTSTAFQAALVAPAAPDGPSLEVVAAEPGRLRAGSTGDRSAELAAVVDVVREAHAATGAAPPRRPWLPPLPSVIPAADLPAGTLALVDEPEAQRHTPWAWDPGVPLWRVVGRPRSGRSTALRALVHAAAAREAPDRLHVHVLTTDVTAWPRALPHLGTVAGVGDARAVGALLDHLAAPVGPGSPRRLLVVDGWDQLVDAEDRGPRCPPPSGSCGSCATAANAAPRAPSRVGATCCARAGPASAGRCCSSGRATRSTSPFSAPTPPVRGPRPARVAGSGCATGGRCRSSTPARHPRPPRRSARSPPGPTDPCPPASAAGTSAPTRQGAGSWAPSPPTAPRGRGDQRHTAGDSSSSDRPAPAAAPPSRRSRAPWPRAGAPSSSSVPTARPEAPAGPGWSSSGRTTPTGSSRCGRRTPTSWSSSTTPTGSTTPRSGRSSRRSSTSSSVTAGQRSSRRAPPRSAHGSVASTSPSPATAPASSCGPERTTWRCSASPAPTSPRHPTTRRDGGCSCSTDGRRPCRWSSTTRRARASNRRVGRRSFRVVELHVRNPRDERRAEGGQGEDEHEPAEPGPLRLEQADAHRHEEQVPDDGRRPGPAALAEPPPGQQAEAHRAERDDRRRHHDPGRVAALPDGQLVDVEDGEPEQREGLDGAEDGGRPSGAGGRRGSGVERRERNHRRSVGERYDRASRGPPPTPGNTRPPSTR
ncbi:FHA domain-containing protein [Phycicoccus sp. MQZ13P-5]|uniref:FHA domain-containing protein n=1 Tax=Phycicoccus sonneratiae TaxID=2807628 RepID=A0ABS2CLY9_9MICO|nr:FHA domain-containing protein [Phycicoccus sonneraticus]